MYNGILLVFDKSYHDSANNEKSSQPINMFIIYLLQGIIDLDWVVVAYIIIWFY